MKVEIDNNELYAILEHSAKQMLALMTVINEFPASSIMEYRKFTKIQKRFEEILILLNGKLKEDNVVVINDN